jgi:hypothetical protein
LEHKELAFRCIRTGGLIICLKSVLALKRLLLTGHDVFMKWNATILAGIGIVLYCPTSGTRAQQSFDTAVAPVLKSYCFSCHGGAKPKAGLALDRLTPDFEKNADTWHEVMKRISDGSMPPKRKDRPKAVEVKAVCDWVTAELTGFQAIKAARSGRTRLRRLNRIEYANTIRDLLGVEVDIEALPEDGIASGFDNVDGALDLSPNLLERYLACGVERRSAEHGTGTGPL